MSINWYPGHMTGAKRQMLEDVKRVDVIIELIDARIPLSSRNPDIDNIAGARNRVLVFNKCDMADAGVTADWINYYKSQTYDYKLEVHKCDSRKRNEVLRVNDLVKKVCEDKLKRDRERGIIARPIKAMVVGIPNVGKSTFINSYVGKATAKTGNKPGVTRGNQWIRISKDINLLDTPGILWPKLGDENTGLCLAYIGSINDNILDIRDVSIHLLDYLKKYYCKELTERYKITGDVTCMDSYELLLRIADITGCKRKGGEPDEDKQARQIIDDLRSGKLGRISLERPDKE